MLVIVAVTVFTYNIVMGGLVWLLFTALIFSIISVVSIAGVVEMKKIFIMAMLTFGMSLSNLTIMA